VVVCGQISVEISKSRGKNSKGRGDRSEEINDIELAPQPGLMLLKLEKSNIPNYF
jgi:hypothetical protein